MKEDQSKEKNGRLSPVKLTFLLIIIPLTVITLVIVSWFIFKETRKQVDLTEHLSNSASLISLVEVEANKDTKLI